MIASQDDSGIVEINHIDHFVDKVLMLIMFKMLMMIIRNMLMSTMLMISTTCMEFSRSLASPGLSCQLQHREQLNQV